MQKYFQTTKYPGHIFLVLLLKSVLQTKTKTSIN